MAKLTEKQKRFVEEYLVDLNATQAAIRAGYSPKTANEQGARLLVNVSIQQALQKAMKDREQRTVVTADRVVQELWNIVTADANDIVELRRCCCRYCWGINNRYQLTANEMKARKDSYAIEAAKAAAEGKTIAVFDPLGGIGYDATKEPNPVCPECFGVGVTEPFIKDTRKLPPGVKSLYAGVKVTKDGVEVRMHSKDKAMELLGRHLGMFKDKVEVEIKGGIAERLKRARERKANGAD